MLASHHSLVDHAGFVNMLKRDVVASFNAEIDGRPLPERVAPDGSPAPPLVLSGTEVPRPGDLPAIMLRYLGKADVATITMLQLIVKCADISNAAKADTLYEGWRLRITDEFYRQGDREREQGLPVSKFMDRSAP